MNDRDQRRYDRLTRIQTFGREHAAEFPAASQTRADFAALDTLLARVDEAKAGQTPVRVSRATLVDALTLDLQAIGRTARAIALKDPAFNAAAYRVPDNTAGSKITTHADAVLALLEDNTDGDEPDTPAELAAKAALRAKFIAYEIPAEFVVTLRADRDGIDDATEHNQAENQGGVANTARLGDLLQQGADLVTHLDVAMTNKYDRVPAQLAAWTSASRLERTAQRAKTTTSNGNGTPPPAAPH